MFQGVAQGIAAVEPVFDLAKDLADLVFDGIRAGGALLEALQVGEEFGVDVKNEVVTGHGIIVVKLAVGVYVRTTASYHT